MQKFNSISHFIQSGDFQYRVFDMGRKLISLDNLHFQKIEEQKDVYPYPFQQKAWLALLLWEEGGEAESVVWFLQFPIDELGFLKQQARDAFLIDLLEQTGKNIQAKQNDSKILDELKESPFAFKPSPYRLSIFHAIATRELNQPASHYYQHTRDYLTGDAGFEQWQFLGLQGIADVVARLDWDNNEEMLVHALEFMPVEPLINFSQMLENSQISENMVNALNCRLTRELTEKIPNVLLISALLRGLSGGDCPLRDKIYKIYRKILQLPIASEVEILAAISSRSWDSLKNQALLKLFIEKLAELDYTGFNAILADLLMIPGMREPIFTEMRSPERSSQLGHKFGVFLQTIKET